MKTYMRNSNTELLRIIAMFFIVLSHIGLHSDFSNLLNHNTFISCINDLFILAIQGFGKIGVNIFVLISGYYLSLRVDFDKNKCLKMWFQIFVYSILIYIFSVFIIHNNIFNIHEFVKVFFPISNSRWWFASSYFILFILSPYINKGLNALNEIEFKKVLIIEFVMWSIFPSIFNSPMQSNMFVYMVFMYCIGAYIRRFYFDNNKKCINIETDKKLNKFIINNTIIIAICIYVIVYMCAIIMIIIFNKYSLFEGKYMHFYGIQTSPIVIISILLFIGFEKRKPLYSKKINYIADGVFGVYLIHDNTYMRYFLWKQIFRNSQYQQSSLLIIYLLFEMVLVFCICLIIEKIRKVIEIKIIRIFKRNM